MPQQPPKIIDNEKVYKRNKKKKETKKEIENSLNETKLNRSI